jgi:hypothetical protein
MVVDNPLCTSPRSQAARSRFRSGTKPRTSTPSTWGSRETSRRGPATAIMRSRCESVVMSDHPTHRYR